MIQANEIRVGNLIKSDGVIVTVDARTIFDIWDSSKKYDPIELTPELLEKAGFTKDIIDENDIWLRLRCGQFLFETDESCDFKMVFMKVGARCVRIITKLHELQNLYFALIGKELTL